MPKKYKKGKNIIYRYYKADFIEILEFLNIRVYFFYIADSVLYISFNKFNSCAIYYYNKQKCELAFFNTEVRKTYASIIKLNNEELASRYNKLKAYIKTFYI